MARVWVAPSRCLPWSDALERHWFLRIGKVDRGNGRRAKEGCARLGCLAGREARPHRQELTLLLQRGRLCAVDVSPVHVSLLDKARNVLGSALLNVVRMVQEQLSVNDFPVVRVTLELDAHGGAKT